MTKEHGYLSVMPDIVRIKIVGAVDIDPQLTLNDEEAAILGLIESLQRAYEKIVMCEPLLKRFPKDYTFLQPEPEIATMKKSDAITLINFIKEKTKIDPYATPVALMYRSKIFLLSIEHSCG